MLGTVFSGPSAGSTSKTSRSIEGVLKFKSAPDYEMPTDRANDEDGDGECRPHRMWRAQPTTSTSLPCGSATEGTPATHALRVQVQDVEEDGMVMLSPLQPQVGTPLTAVIVDLDGVVSDAIGIPHAEYQWAKSDSMGGTPTDITGATQRTYTPTEDDENELPAGDGGLLGAGWQAREDGSGSSQITRCGLTPI